MTNRRSPTRLILAATLALCMAAPCLGAGAAAAKKQDPWVVRQYLVERLGGEWYKITLLNGEIDHLRDVCAEMRSFELFPPEATKIREDSLVAIDKNLESIERDYQQIGKELDAMRQPLMDGMAILREMVAGNSVDQMFDVLEEGDLQRIDQLVAVRHRITALWQRVDDLLSRTATQMGVDLAKPVDAAGQNEFMDILRANLGLQYEGYMTRLSALKDSLVVRGAPSSVQAMFRTEVAAIKQGLATVPADVLRERIEVLIHRYTGRRPLHDLNYYLARVLFESGEYAKVLEVVKRIPDDPEYADKKTVYTLEALYQLGEYQKIADLQPQIPVDKLEGSDRNSALWVFMETGMALGVREDYSKLASKMVRDAPRCLAVMHALAQSCIGAGDWATALSVLESARAIHPRDAADQEARNRIELAQGEAYYETGAYDKALSVFFELLNQTDSFEDALYGIVWSYLRQGSFTKAETSLRKLINQSPGSPRAAEAIAIMARRTAEHADAEWAKVGSLSKETTRLRDLFDKVNKKLAVDTTKSGREKYRAAAAELSDLLTRVSGEDRSSYTQIQALYDQSQRMCELLDRYYRTGSFQENAMSGRREKLLHVLDSILVDVQGGTKKRTSAVASFTVQRENIGIIKDLVRHAAATKARVLIDQARWEGEYIDWNKTIIKARLDSAKQSLAKAPDSLTRESLKRRNVALAREVDSLVDVGDAVSHAWNSRLSAAIDTALKSVPDPEDEAYLRYHRGELLYDRENDAYLTEYQNYEGAKSTYDTLLAAFRDGKRDTMPQEPATPVLDHQVSMEEFNRVLERFPQTSIVPAAHYGLAWCYSDMNQPSIAVAQMETLAVKYPQSAYAPQAWMYIGEHRFDHDDLAGAVKAYQHVMTYPDSKWFDDALYKLAWTQYRLSNPEKAISTFLALVDLGGGKTNGRSVLEKESMDYIALSFSESDMTGEKGLERASRFVERFGDDVRGSQILHQLAKVYRDQGRYDMAKQTYRRLLTTYPNNNRNPLIEREFIGVLAKELPDSSVNKLKMDFYKKYNTHAPWSAAQADPATKTEGDSLASTMLYDVALGYHQIALGKNDSASYNRAVRTYEEYIKAYPLSKKANECHYNMAEIVFSLGNYERAAEEYMAVSKRYPDSKYRETAAWNAIVASQNLLKKEKPDR